MEKIDYSQVPHNYGVCASVDCPRSATCLRHLVLEHAPATRLFLPTLTPAALKAIKGDCPYYRPTAPIRYARGLLHLVGSMDVRTLGIFRSDLVNYFGRKNYYLVRKGEAAIHPDEQAYIVRLVKKLNVQVGDCFDAYFEGYDW